MNYREWLLEAPAEITGDPLWKMEVYRLARFAADVAWIDVTRLVSDRRTIGLADQLYRSAGAVSADICEGYSRQSGKDQARFYEYALGSAREARNWCFEARHVLGADVNRHRLRLWTQIIRQLLLLLPSERGYHMKEESVSYSAIPNDLLENMPLPPTDDSFRASPNA